MNGSLQKVTLFAFNDFHRRLDPLPDGTAGAARLVGKLRQLKADNPGSLVVNLGDVAGDNKKLCPELFSPIADLFERAQVDVLTLGNHEFEDSSDNYSSLRQGLIEPFKGEVLCANVAQDGQAIEGTKPYTIKQLAGMNIALVGVVTTDLSSRMHPLAGAGLQVANLEETLANLVPQLEKQADAVVVLGHEGLDEMVEATREVAGIDVTLAAHDHKLTTEAVEVARPDGSKAYVSEAGAYGKHINQIDLYFDPEAHKLVNVQLTTHLVDSTAPSDPVAESIVRSAPKLDKAVLPKIAKEKPVSFSSFADMASAYHASRA